MADPANLGMVFVARKLSEAILSRGGGRFSTDQIIKWAEKCAAKWPEASRDSIWWMQSAIVDCECLDAAIRMLTEGIG